MENPSKGDSSRKLQDVGTYSKPLKQKRIYFRQKMNKRTANIEEVEWQPNLNCWSSLLLKRYIFHHIIDWSQQLCDSATDEANQFK